MTAPEPARGADVGEAALERPRLTPTERFAAQTVTCPYCWQAPGDGCRTLSFGNQRFSRSLTEPHLARVRLATTEADQ